MASSLAVGTAVYGAPNSCSGVLLRLSGSLGLAESVTGTRGGRRVPVTSPLGSHNETTTGGLGARGPASGLTAQRRQVLGGVGDVVGEAHRCWGRGAHACIKPAARAESGGDGGS